MVSFLSSKRDGFVGVSRDKHAWEQQTDSPTATRYGFRLVAQCAAKQTIGICFIWTSRLPSFRGKHYNTESRSVIIQLPNDIGLPPWMVGVCLRPVYGLNDAPRRWWNRLDKFLVSIGLEPTRADRCNYVGYQGIESQKPKPYKAKSVQEEGSPFGEESSMYSDSASSYLKEVALSALNCYALMMKTASLPPRTQRRKGLICHVLILLPVSILLTLRRWSTMPGDLLLTLNCWVSLVVWLTRKEVGSHMRMDKL